MLNQNFIILLCFTNKHIKFYSVEKCTFIILEQNSQPLKMQGLIEIQIDINLSTNMRL